MNRLTSLANSAYDTRNDVEAKSNLIIAVFCGIFLGVMLALGV